MKENSREATKRNKEDRKVNENAKKGSYPIMLIEEKGDDLEDYDQEDKVEGINFLEVRASLEEGEGHYNQTCQILPYCIYKKGSQIQKEVEDR